MAARAAADANVARGSSLEHRPDEIGRIDRQMRGQVVVGIHTLIEIALFMSS